jgi:hypothetical protein
MTPPMTESSPRMRIVVYYAVWAAICAAVAGVVFAFIHTWLFSATPGGPTLLSGAGTALAIAAGQGAVAFVTGSLLARGGRTLAYTLVLGLALGAFDFAMYFLQMAVPSTELGWGPDIAILVAAAALITVLGAKKTGL